jgi:mono/diheme cytochrome c family protein
MKLNRVFFGALAGVILVAARLLADNATPTNTTARTEPVYVPDLLHEHDPLPDGVLAWDDLIKSVDAAADQDDAHFTFNFTNVSSGNVYILDVHPSCGCTTAQLPQLPWMIAPGTNGQIGVTVNLNGKNGVLLKSVTVATDKGSKDLMVRINILPPVTPTLTDEARAQGMIAAKVDRQAVFKNDCATCHVKRGEGKYGQALFDADCGICHEGPNRATMVPDLHAIKTLTNAEFWQTWIAHGKPGSLMPAFSTADGGPLTDIQIASLVAYLDSAIPSKMQPPR